MGKTAEERFWDQIDLIPESTCWHWSGCLVNKGYGVIRVGETKVRAHRFSYELHFGKIPPGLECCHKCDSRDCCNPHHLFLGTHKENMEDCSKKKRTSGQKKTECPKGHQFSEENTYLRKGGTRECLECMRHRGMLRRMKENGVATRRAFGGGVRWKWPIKK